MRDVSLGGFFYGGRNYVEVKLPITFDAQLDKLKRRGCIVTDEIFARMKLEQINYYRLTAYFLPFLQDDGTYKLDTSFDTVYRIYEFDRRLRGLILSAVEEIELMLRTQLAYYHAHKYGPLGYLDAASFKPYRYHARMLEHVERAIENNSTKAFVQHHLQRYESKFPLWVIIELFTVGELSRFYADMHRADKKSFARSLYHTTDVNVSSWLQCMSNLRNDCAHYARLYDTKFGTVPARPEGFSYRLRDRVFDYILVLKFLYPDPIQWQNTFMTALSALIEEYRDTIDMRCIGFPHHWEQMLLASNPAIK